MRIIDIYLYLLSYFCFALANFDACQAAVQRVLTSQRLKEKASGFPHMVCLSFIGKCIRNLMLEVDAVRV